MDTNINNIINVFTNTIYSCDYENLIDELNSKGLITDNLEYGYLSDLQSNSGEIDKFEEINKFEIHYFITIDNMPYRIILKRILKDWKIDSFEFLCMGCLNDDQLNKINCGVCGGSGWGAQ